MSNDPGRYDPRNYAIESTGNAEEDQAQILDHVRSSMMMDEGLCPNGCGPRLPGMEEGPGDLSDLGIGGSHCPVCHFVTNQSMPA